MKWIDELQSGKKAELWSEFHPVREQDVEALEVELGRSLPIDFKEFYQKIGYGRWPDKFGGGIYSPDEILEVVGAPIYYVLGSLFPGKEWASAAEHRKLWLSRGGFNPNPQRFSTKSLEFYGMNLLDLLQIGSDGSACYQMLNLSESSANKYVVICESTEVELVAESFRDGIYIITDLQIDVNDA